MLYSPFASLFSLFVSLVRWINDNNGENGDENSENSRQNGESDWRGAQGQWFSMDRETEQRGDYGVGWGLPAMAVPHRGSVGVSWFILCYPLLWFASKKKRGEVARRILVTGGTVFVSKYIARYFADLGEQVVVLNRNTKEQLEDVAVIEADRHALGNVLSGQHFDAVIDVTAYNAQDVDDLARALESVTFDTYVMISSSAVYPTTNLQPFVENGRLGLNSKHEVWGQYSEGKVAAERAVLEQIANAYIIRPPYLYGPMNNIYREAFVFDCADAERAFRLPGDGEMRLQFFHVRDLCRFIDVIIAQQPQQHVFNVGNPESVSVREWVELCYRAAGKPLECVAVHNVPQRSFFPFYDYQYELDVRAQRELMPETTPLAEGLRESYAWYSTHRNEVVPKPYMKFIDEELPAAPASVR